MDNSIVANYYESNNAIIVLIDRSLDVFAWLDSLIGPSELLFISLSPICSPNFSFLG
jgi:hypothetical protein